MSAQGWQPGQYLGAKDAKHAEFHTAANASHIRVTLKDDNLGIGAKIGSGVGHGECTGLDAFKNLLGRLNGKDEDEIEKEQRSRDDLKRAIYTEKRWGSIRFVPGGFLIGDKIQFLIDGEAERIRKLAAVESSSASSDSSDSSSSESEEEAATPVDKQKKSKKRKIDAVDEEDAEIAVVKVRTSKKKGKRETRREEEAEIESTPLDEKAARKKAKKERKAAEAAKNTPEESNAQRRREKKERKEQRRLEEEKAASKDAEKRSKREKKSKRSKDKASTDSSLESSQTSTKESTPATPITIDTTSGRSTPLMGGRHAVRARNIAQKRMASMDIASLNQVSSIPPTIS